MANKCNKIINNNNTNNSNNSKDPSLEITNSTKINNKNKDIKTKWEDNNKIKTNLWDITIKIIQLIQIPNNNNSNNNNKILDYKIKANIKDIINNICNKDPLALEVILIKHILSTLNQVVMVTKAK